MHRTCVHHSALQTIPAITIHHQNGRLTDSKTPSYPLSPASAGRRGGGGGRVLAERHGRHGLGPCHELPLHPLLVTPDHWVHHPVLVRGEEHRWRRRPSRGLLVAAGSLRDRPPQRLRSQSHRSR
jgi:hypothetical protein